MSNKLFEQQLNLFLQQLEKVWQKADDLPEEKTSSAEVDELPVAQKAVLKESLDDLKNSLGNLQLVVEELYKNNQKLLSDKVAAEDKYQYYKTLFELAPDGYLVTTKEGQILEANQKAIELLNISPKRLIGKPLVVFISIEERRNFYLQMHQLQQGVSIQDWQIEIQRRRGVCFTTSIDAAPIFNQQGDLEKLRWRILEPIHAPKLSSQQQINSKVESVEINSESIDLQLQSNPTSSLEIISEQLRKPIEEIGNLLDRLFSRVFEFFVICDRAGKFIYINPAVAQTWNLSQEDLSSKSWQHLEFTDETIKKFETQQKQLFTSKCIINDQVDMITLEGVKTYQYTMKKISNLSNYPEANMVTFQDIGKKQLSNNSHLLASKESDSSKNHFTSLFIQKLRDPLNNILACNQLIESELQTHSNNNKNIYVQGLKTNIKLVNQLLDDLILMNKIETRQIQLKPSLIDLTEFCRRLTEELQQDLDSPNKISIIKQGKPCGVWDEKLLRQTLSNLLISAIQYSPKGSEIALEVVCQGKQVTFNIHNYNSELSQKERNLILDVLTQETNVEILEEKDLRLLIAKECIKVQKGELLLEYKNSETMFKVKLPLNQRVEKRK